MLNCIRLLNSYSALNYAFLVVIPCLWAFELYTTSNKDTWLDLIDIYSIHSQRSPCVRKTVQSLSNVRHYVRSCVCMYTHEHKLYVSDRCMMERFRICLFCHQNLISLVFVMLSMCFLFCSALEPRCHVEFNSVESSFTSPNYPQKYFRDFECSWVILVSQGILQLTCRRSIYVLFSAILKMCKLTIDN